MQNSYKWRACNRWHWGYEGYRSKRKIELNWSWKKIEMEIKIMKPWCLILNFLDFIKQTYIDFFKEIRLISLQAIGLNTCKIYLREIFKHANNYFLSCETWSGNGLGKKLQDQLKTYFHSFWRHNVTIGWALHAISSCLNNAFCSL